MLSFTVHGHLVEEKNFASVLKANLGLLPRPVCQNLAKVSLHTVFRPENNIYVCLGSVNTWPAVIPLNLLQCKAQWTRWKEEWKSHSVWKNSKKELLILWIGADGSRSRNQWVCVSFNIRSYFRRQKCKLFCNNEPLCNEETHFVHFVPEIKDFHLFSVGDALSMLLNFGHLPASFLCVQTSVTGNLVW